MATPVSLLQEDLQKPNSLWRDAFRRLLKNKLSIMGAIVIIIVATMAIFAPIIAPYGPIDQNFDVRFSGPTLQNIMGADNLGRDMFSRIVYGSRVSLQVGIVAVSVATLVGTTLGIIAGYSNRIVDEIIMRGMDILYAFPAILLAIAIMAALGRGIGNAMIAIGVVYIPIFARITRGAVLGVKNDEFITAAQAMGAGDIRIMVVHILPNILSPIIVEITLSLAFAILAEAALSFFALGTQPPDASWGRMLSEGREYFRQSSWMGVFPGLAIFFTVMGFNFLGDGLRDALDPRLRR